MVNSSPAAGAYIFHISKVGAGEQRGCNRAALQPGTLECLRLRHRLLRLTHVEVIGDVPGIWRASNHVLESSRAAEVTMTITGSNALADVAVSTVRGAVENDGPIG
ncbi:hypothetical protein ACPROK_01595 [Glutamicibacter soli]|uniref:Uncharacterized protein n=1 Tax=Glutamicibacter soli TaxID=453836 RepID=A0A365YN82_9MICC|nr:hypothetical protein [Glutamicibacter soli]RBM04078.1 hypothetical protein C1H84_01920 [Glutamicibacter soli]